MRSWSRFLVIVLLMVSFGTSVQAVSTFAFTMNISPGSRGGDVAQLQRILNEDPATRIASTGPGSPGNETDYFGSLTKAAVVRFQAKYASEVLTPAGLTQGNGFVGLYTRAKLTRLVSEYANRTPLPSPTPSPSPTVPSSVPISQNPNLKNLDRLVADIDTVAIKKGYSAAAIAAANAQIIKSSATTTDLRAAFLKQAQKDSHAITVDDSFTDGILARIRQSFDTVFTPHAHAAVGIPFGGALLGAFYCTQSATWLIDLEPLPPSYAVVLTYIPGTEAFASYNIPLTTELLGSYAEPGICIAGICPACTEIPSEGMITPMVGSAPL